MDEIKKLELENKILRVQINEVYEFALETRNKNVQLNEEIDIEITISSIMDLLKLEDIKGNIF